MLAKSLQSLMIRHRFLLIAGFIAAGFVIAFANLAQMRNDPKGEPVARITLVPGSDASMSAAVPTEAPGGLPVAQPQIGEEFEAVLTELSLPIEDRFGNEDSCDTLNSSNSRVKTWTVCNEVKYQNCPFSPSQLCKVSTDFVNGGVRARVLSTPIRTLCLLLISPMQSLNGRHSQRSPPE